MPAITPADLRKAIDKAINHARNEADNASEPGDVGMWMLIEDALSRLDASAADRIEIARRYSNPGLEPLIRDFITDVDSVIDDVNQALTKPRPEQEQS